ncbi:NAD(P)-dependent oxidoreductase [Devosia ginsengisoli]|uniref:NAD(P)-dependent oxidoreductase n=1 Tax=Devosia ginsengisoli TaxID=400770 RepID=UPI0026EADFAD|nr:NAD(P)-dependent oxidoreductase [Devosia ginsengisoli]MCR6672430.1 NAD(P)-binding domain-containing protein [Devosia ginsengisoli]
MPSDPVFAPRRIAFYGTAFADRRNQVQALLGDGFETVHVPADLDPDATAQALGGAYAVVAVSTVEGLPLPQGLKLLQVPGIGWDGVRVEHVPASASIANVAGHEIAVAEYCLTQLLDWCHRLRETDAEFRAGSWARSSRFGAAPHRELRGTTVGIVGYGGIGRELARMLKALGVRVLAANRSASAFDDQVETGFALGDIPTMFEQCDFAVVAAALTPQTEGLIGKDALDALGADGVLVNVARGPVVAEEALYEALAGGRLGGAVIDVWYCYPERLDDPDPAPSRFNFAALPNVVMTPHVSGWTEGTASRRVAVIAENLRRAAAGDPLLNVVATGTREA